MIPALWKPTPQPSVVCAYQAPCPCCAQLVWWQSRIDAAATRTEVTEVCANLRRAVA